jgi:hypothetical protein
MSIGFGKPKTAWYGKTRLTKVINRGGFGVSTGLDIDKVRVVAIQTCNEFPVKKARLIRSPMRPLIRVRKGVEVISYGIVATSKKTGEEYMPVPSWELALGNGTGAYRYRITLAYAKLFSGKIDEVEELEYFLNELERNLRRLDPQAMIALLEQR